jgi:hypothetical protein
LAASKWVPPTFSIGAAQASAPFAAHDCPIDVARAATDKEFAAILGAFSHGLSGGIHKDLAGGVISPTPIRVHRSQRFANRLNVLAGENGVAVDATAGVVAIIEIPADLKIIRWFPFSLKRFFASKTLCLNESCSASVGTSTFSNALWYSALKAALSRTAYFIEIQ